MFPIRFTIGLLALSSGLAAAGPLAVPPSEAIGKLSGLDPTVRPMSPEEARLIADANDGTFDRHTLAESCLLVGAVKDEKDRRKYLKRLDELETEARKATAEANSATDRADRLLAYLHAGPLAKGFRADQTNLHALLDTRQFNCVSSVALYTILGRRLGLELSVIEVPEHLFVALHAGGRTIELETTDPRGFDADPNRKLGPTKADRRSAARRQLGEPGLAAVIAFNRGVTLADSKKYAEAMRAYLVALALDSSNSLAAKNAVACLANWPVDLARTGKYTDAAAVLVIGRELAPRDPNLLTNTLAVYDAWADSFIRRNEWSAAVRVYQAGLKLLPGNRHLEANLAYCRERLRH
jgi:tetratricopeptide (TPR) repeat protein